ncbi:MAG: hypothetical protein A2169_06260, partial [Deltaproteobacteria bacterium RBG_13_47_9]
MKDFEYFAPGTVEEALTLLSQYREEIKIIAGGQSMLVTMRQGLLAPECLMDIKGVSSLDYIHYDEKEGLKIGALTTHRTIEKSPLIRKHFGVLSEMEVNLATIQTRNWGTIGGNLCHGDPSGDPAPVFIALNAKLKLIRQGEERIIPMEEFSKDFLEVDLGSDEMLAEIQVPVLKPLTGTAYEKLTAIQGDSGMVGASVSLTLSSQDGVCQDARVVLSNVSSVPFRAREAESRLIGKKISDDLLIEAGQTASAEVDPISDMHA